MAIVTTSVVVSFDAAAEGEALFTAEVDGRPQDKDGLNGGKTSFVPGDDVWILLYKTDNVNVVFAEPSLGSLTHFQNKDGVSDEEGFIEITGESKGDRFEHTFSKPVEDGTFNHQWIGNNLGNFTIQNYGAKLVLSQQPPGDYYVAVMKYDYKAPYLAYKLSGTNFALDNYQIVCFFAGEVV